MSQSLFRDRGTSVSRPMTAAQRMILAQTKRDNPTVISNDTAHNDDGEACPATSGLLAHIQSVISSPPAPQRLNQHDISLHPTTNHSYNPPRDNRSHPQRYSETGQDSPYRSQTQHRSDENHAFAYDDAEEHWSDADTLSSARSPRYPSFAHTEPTPYSPGSSSSLASHEGKHPQYHTSQTNAITTSSHTSSAREADRHLSLPPHQSFRGDLDTPQSAPAPASRLAVSSQQQYPQHQPQQQSSPSSASPPFPNTISTSTSTSLNFYYPPPSHSPSAEQRLRLAAVLRAHTHTQPPSHPTHSSHPPHLATQHHHDSTAPRVAVEGLSPHGRPSSDNSAPHTRGAARQSGPGLGPVHVQGRLPLPLSSTTLATRANVPTHAGSMPSMLSGAIRGSGVGKHDAATRTADEHADFDLAAAYSMLPRSFVAQTHHGDHGHGAYPNPNPAASNTSVAATAPTAAAGASTTVTRAAVGAAAGASASLSVAERLRRRTAANTHANTHATAHAGDGEPASVSATAVAAAPPASPVAPAAPGTSATNTVGTTTHAANSSAASTHGEVNATGAKGSSGGRRAATPTRARAPTPSGAHPHVATTQTTARALVLPRARAPTPTSARSHVDGTSRRPSVSASASRANTNTTNPNGNINSNSNGSNSNGSNSNGSGTARTTTRSKADTTTDANTNTNTNTNTTRPSSSSASASAAASHPPQRPSRPPSPPTPEPRRFLPQRTRPATHPATQPATHAVAQVHSHSLSSSLPPPPPYEVSSYGQQLLRAIHDPAPGAGMATNTGTAVRADLSSGGVSGVAGAGTSSVDSEGADAGHGTGRGQYVHDLQEGHQGSLAANTGAGTGMSSTGMGTGYGELAVTHSIPAPPSGFARNVNTEVSVHNDVAVDTGAFTQRLRVPAVNMTMGNLWRELEHDNRQLNSVNKELLSRIEALEGALHERTAALGEVTARAEQAEDRCVALERAEAKMREEKGQFMRAITEQAGLLGQSKTALETLQAGVEALKSRLESVSGEKEAVVAMLEEVKGECKGVEKERNMLKHKLDKAQETIASTEAAKTELESHVKVLKQAEKTKSRQLSTAVLEKRRYMEAFDRALTFVKSKHIPSTVGEGGLRLQKLLLELLRVDEEDMRGKDKSKEERESSERAREALLRRLRADTEPSRGGESDEARGDVEEEEDSVLSPNRAGQGTKSRDRSEMGKQSDNDALLQLLQPSKDTARGSKSGMSGMGISGAKDNGKGSKLSLRERLRQQAEYVSSLQATVRTLREQNLTLTQRFRVAAEEKKKLQRKLERLERQAHYPQDEEEGAEEAGEEERHNAGYDTDAAYDRNAGYDRDVGYEAAANGTEYKATAPAYDPVDGGPTHEEGEEGVANDSVYFLLRRTASPARAGDRRAREFTTATTPTAAPTLTIIPAGVDSRGVHVYADGHPDTSVGVVRGSAADAEDGGNVSGVDMVQWRSVYNIDDNNRDTSTYNAEFHPGFPRGGYNPDSYRSFSQSYTASDSHYTASHGVNSSQLDAIDADYHTLLSAAAVGGASMAYTGMSSITTANAPSPPVHGHTQAAGTSNGYTSVDAVVSHADAVAYGEDDVYARALTELHQSLALLDGNATHRNDTKHEVGINGDQDGGHGDDSVEYDIDKMFSKTSSMGMNPVRETERTSLGNPLLVHLSGEVAAMSAMTTRSNPFYQPRQ